MRIVFSDGVYSASGVGGVVGTGGVEVHGCSHNESIFSPAVFIPSTLCVVVSLDTIILSSLFSVLSYSGNFSDWGCFGFISDASEIFPMVCKYSIQSSVHL